MRTLITTAVGTAALGLAVGLGTARAQEIPAEVLVGETLYAPVDPNAVVGPVADVPADWVALGVVASLAEEGGALVVEMAEEVGFGAAGVPVRVQDMRLVPDADAEDAYFLVFDGNLRELESEAREVAQDRAAQAAAADGELFGQDDEMAETPGARGADGVTDEGEPITTEGGATAGDAEEDAEVLAEGVPVDAETGVEAVSEGVADPGEPAAVEGDAAPEAQAVLDTEGADEAAAPVADPAQVPAQVVVTEPAEPEPTTGATIVATAPETTAETVTVEPGVAEADVEVVEAAPSAAGAEVVTPEPTREASDVEVTVVEPEPAEPEVEVAQAEPQVTPARPTTGGGAQVVVVEPEPAGEAAVTGSADLEPEAVLVPETAEAAPAEEPLRAVDIAEPGAPPIEDAENVVPTGDEQLRSETEVTSPSATAAAPGDATPVVPGDDTGAAIFPAPEGFAAADIATMDVTELLGVRVYDRTDEEVGEIGSWVGETAPGAVPEAAVIEVGGFLGLGERRVAVPSDRLTLMADADGNGLRVYTDITQDELEALPEVE